MMGVIMNYLLSFVEEVGGSDALEKLREKISLKREKFDDNRIYPEEEFQKLLKATLEILRVDRETAEREFAHWIIKRLQEDVPEYFRRAKNAYELLKLDPLVHREWPAMGGKPRAKISMIKCEPDEIIFRYESPNKLCTFMKTLIEDVLEIYNEKGEITEEECMKKGDHYCIIRVKFLGKK